MQLESFFESISFISLKVLPLLGAVLLVYLIIMIKNVITCLKSATKTLDEANNQLRKLDVPLNTVAEISKSVDYVHDLTKESVKSVSTTIYQNMNQVKELFNKTIHKVKKEDKTEVTVEEVIPTEENKGEQHGK